MASRLLALLYIERGINELKHGDRGRGFAFLGQAYQAADVAKDDQLRRSVCSLLGAWESMVGHRLLNDSHVSAIAFSSDGTKFVAAGGASVSGGKGEVRSWDVTTGQPLSSAMWVDQDVSAVALSSDGTKVATASKYHEVRVWATATGTLLGPPMKHEGVWTMFLSPDGTKLVTVGYSRGPRKGGVQVWDVATGQPMNVRMKHDGYFDLVAFSPDGSKLATVIAEKTVLLWDATTCQPLGSPMKHESKVISVTFSPDGTRVATASGDIKSDVQLWAATTGQPLGAPIKHDDRLSGLFFDPDGSKVLTATNNIRYTRTEIRLWSARTGEPLGVLIKEDATVLTVAFSPDGTKFATATNWEDRGETRLWDATTCRPLGRPMKHDDTVFAVTFSPDGRKIATAGGGESIHLWDVTNGQRLGPTLVSYGKADRSADARGLPTVSWDETDRLWDAMGENPPQFRDIYFVRDLTFSPDCTKAATRSSIGQGDVFHMGELRLWNAATGQTLGQLASPGDSGNLVAFSLDSTKIATAGYRATRLWDATTCKPLGTLIEHDNAVWSIVLSPDGTKVAIATGDGLHPKYEAQLWDPATGKPLSQPLSHDDSVKAMAFSPDGTKLATASADKTWLWETLGGKPLGKPFKHDTYVGVVAFSPDGSRLATTCFRMARLWDVATGRPLGEPMQHYGEVTTVAFSLDGTKIVTGSEDKTARLWDAATGRPLGEPMQHGEEVTTVAFSPDGTKVATVVRDPRKAPQGRVWSVPKSLPDVAHLVRAYVDVVSGWREDANAVLRPISAAQADSAWQELVKSHEWLDSRRQEAARLVHLWHESEAYTNYSAQRWRAAAFHLRWLSKNEPENAEWLRRLRRIEAMTALQSPISQIPLTRDEADVALLLVQRLPGVKKLVETYDRWSWSPDSSQLVFIAHGKKSRAIILDMKTGEMRDLVEDASALAWSPGDGRWIAFCRTKEHDKEIWLIPSAGGTPKKIFNGSSPSWSADGVAIYSPELDGIAAIDVQTAEARHFADVNDCKAIWPHVAISPDGKRIAFHKNGKL
ncbi:MAG: hypothetical protein ABSG53_11470, partial [Thermoguttaceae bacterium]